MPMKKKNSSNFYNIFSGIELNIVEEKINNGIMYKGYHNGKLVDTLFIENDKLYTDKLYTDKLDGLVNYKRGYIYANGYSLLVMIGELLC